MKNSKISIIIRTKNEERWVSACLQAIYEQTYQNFEIIIVDNNSSDKTIEKVKQFNIDKILNIDNYLPGKSLNIGINSADGDYIVCISAHCIPVNKYWLENLLVNFEDKKVAGVYGRQEPLPFSSDFDKRDLMVVFGLDKKVQKKDSFFHNANSMIRKDLLDKYPFDEKTTNIEDRIWATEVLKAGYTLIYEPEASVYHYHGIHQNRDETRCSNVVRIMEDLHNIDKKTTYLDLNQAKIVAIVPVMGKTPMWNDEPLLLKTINDVKSSKFISDIFVSTDDDYNISLAEENGVKVIKRDASLSKDYVGLEQVIQYTLDKIESQDIFPDIIVVLEQTFPNRPENLIDNMLKELIVQGFDAMLPAKKEYKSIWKKDNGKFVMLEKEFVPRKYKEPWYLGLKGLCFITHSYAVRSGDLMAGNIGLFEIENEKSVIEVR